MNDWRTALGLLTVLPVRYDALRISARALAWYPLVGLLIGGLLVTASALAQFVLPQLVVAVLVVALWAIITGGLHLDGFADTCDALFASATRERRLEILRDVHLGTFGAAGLILLMMLKVATVANAMTAASIFLTPILGRWAIVFAAAFPLARREGMAAMFIAGLTRREILIATISVIPLCGILGWHGVFAFAGAAVVAALIARFAENRLGGLTGDIYGMICESVEVSVLILGTIKIF